MSSRQAEKEKARAERVAREQADARRSRRNRRLMILGGVACVAALFVVVAIVVSSGGGGSSSSGGNGKRPAGIAAVKSRFQGIPQQGTVLGNPKAPVTIVEYADLKCPVCKDFAKGALPTLVDKYVRSGDLRMDIKWQSFVGEQLNPGDSPRAARYALAAAKQNRMWQFADLFYLNQKDESTRYVSDAFLKKISSGVAGLNESTAMKDRNSPAITKQLQAAEQSFSNNGFSGTPSFLIGRTGGTLSPLNYSSFDPSEFTKPINKLLNR